MKPLSVLITILLLTGILVISLPLLSIYFQWLANNFTSGVLFWVGTLGVTGLIIIGITAANLLDDIQE